MLDTSIAFNRLGGDVERSRGVRIYGVLIVGYGAFNLLSVGNFGQFSLMFKGLLSVVTAASYVFSIVYGICGVYCGMKILRLEDWARKAMVALTSASIVLGIFVNKTVMLNFKEYLLSGKVPIEPEMVGPVYNCMIVLTVLVTLFELSIVFFLTRQKVIEQFRKSEQ